MLYVAGAIFILMVFQTLLSIVQIKAYQKTVKAMKGTGVLGIGFKRSFLNPGEIVVLSYNRVQQRVYGCRRMRGITVFERFRNVKEYEGLSLEEIREIAIKQDAKINKRLRKKLPYDSSVLDKKKAALIQAVEAIDRRIALDASASQEMPETTIGKEDAVLL